MTSIEFSDARNQAALDAVTAPKAAPKTLGPRQWFLRVPAPLKQGRPDWLNSNDRRNRYEQANLVKVWRHQAHLSAREHRLPKGIDRVRVDVVVHYPNTSRKRDAHNVAPTIKACLDGIKDAGFVQDDNDKHIALVTIRAGETLTRPCLSITLTEVTDD